MANYKTIHGTLVRDYTTNPDNPIEGQVWYNETDQVLKYIIPNFLASWRTANSLNTARSYLGGCGTQTAGLAFGGEAPPLSAATEEWSGNSTTIKVLTD